MYAFVMLMTSAAFSAAAGEAAEFSGDAVLFALPELLSHAPSPMVVMKSIEVINVRVKKSIPGSQ
jgi:hypothetical protein